MENFILEVKKSPRDDRDFLVGAIYSSPVVLPKTLDYRPDLPPIRNQGAQGSCSAQTAASMKEWQEYTDVQYIGYMSPQFVYNLRENAGEYGMYPRDTMKILKNEGIVPEKEYPYESTEDISDDLKAAAKMYVINGYARIYTVEDLKKALVANGPCYLAFPVRNWGPEFWRNLGNDANYGGHAVTCVGYTEDSFIIRNSWGDDWGYEGYTYFPFLEFDQMWEAWTTMDAESNPVPIDPEPEVEPEPPAPDPDPVPEPEVEPEPAPEPEPEPTPEEKKKELEDDLKKKSNEKLSFLQKLFFCFNKKV
jgi:hypothetical protein